MTIAEHVSMSPEAARRYRGVDIHVFERAGADDAYPIALHVPGGRDFPRGYLTLDEAQLAECPTPDAYGRALGNMVFARDALGDAYQETLAVFQTQGERPRVRLCLDPPALHALHWERLYHPVAGMWYPLAATTDALLSRYVPAQSWEQPALLTARPLRLLVVLASPRGVDLPGLAPFSEAELAGWHRLFAQLPGVEVTFLQSHTPDAPTLDRIRDALATGYHLLHIVSHGVTGRHSTALYLEDAAGAAEEVRTGRILEVLRTVHLRPQLTFLAACESGDAGRGEDFLSLGPALVAGGGIPAVVAMAGRIGFVTAQAFAADFYRHLLAHGWVDLAVQQARAGVRERWDWSVPVLFSRLPDNRLLAEPRPARVVAQTSDQRGPGATQRNITGTFTGPVGTSDGDVIDLRGSQGPVIKPTGPVTQYFGSPPVSPVSTPVDTAALRARLQRLDDVQIDTLCIDHFPDVYDTFGRGMRRDEKINRLLDHCRRNPEDAARLAGLV